MRGAMGLALVVTMASVPALADVKAGVEAWARGDWATAVREWREPAVAGDADAQFNLGQAYKLGRGVPMNLTEAETWYARAAQQGHRQAEDNYGLILFQNGKRPEAVQWLEKSAARGEARSQFVLGTMLFNGDAVTKDWRRAYALMTRASSAGLPQAAATLAQMDRYVPLPDRQAALTMARDLERGAG
ncbi:tetratricopeptide repeat protein, partial [Sphingomonas sp. Leaf10]|uniref:tetratricopeptide repeat protein n=1 Tax=Sphingomonas sp. Leaf10 TaxID=1735676 RepID=UPI00138F5787